MYGITGTWDPESTNSEHLESVVARMANAICHQGSTDTETWIDPENGLGGIQWTRRMDPPRCRILGLHNRPLRGRIQWPDLQLPRTTAPTGAGRSIAQRIVVHRGSPSRCRRVGYKPPSAVSLGFL